MKAAGHSTASATGAGIGRPPIPHEHGAWVILYAPLVLGFGASGVFAPVRWLLLIIAVTGLFLAREAAGLILRGRGKAGTGLWLALYIGQLDEDKVRFRPSVGRHIDSIDHFDRLDVAPFPSEPPA